MKAQNTYPCLTKLKAAEVRGLVPAIAAIAQTMCNGSEESIRQGAIMKHLATASEVMHKADYTMTSSEYKIFQLSATKFLLEYNWLAAHAMENDEPRFSVVPKHHYFAHLVQQARFLNPRFTWCYSSEDFVGRMSALAHSCLVGTPIYQVASCMLDKYRVAMHLRYSLI